MKKAIITDLDNTLFDWVDIWYNSFSAMLEQMVQISGLPEDVLKPEIRAVHQKHGTSEYAFLLEELPSLIKFCDGRDPKTVFEPAINAYRAARKKSLHLYPTVADTLRVLVSRDVHIVAYTESMAFYTNYRLRKLELDSKIDLLFSPRDHDLPLGMDVANLRKYPSENYELERTVHKHTTKGKFKPSPEILRSIISEIGLQPNECVYVGDSLHKDIAMAKDVGVDHAWAKYGIAQKRPEYELLREVTHWNDVDVEREKQIAERDIKPDVILKNNFGEILEQFDLVGT